MESGGVNQWVLLAFNALLGIASLFGGMWLKRMESDMAEMRKSMTEQNNTMHEKLADKVGSDDFREFRRELREQFGEVLSRMDNLRDRIAEKADRS